MRFSKKAIIIALWVFLCLGFLVGCSAGGFMGESLDDSVFEVEFDNQTIVNEYHTLYSRAMNLIYGTWTLEKIVLQRLHQAEVDTRLYGIPVNYDNFLGYKFEITEYSVTLGDRMLNCPNFSVMFRTEEEIFFADEHVWFPRSYDSPYDFLHHLRKGGVSLGFENFVENSTSFVGVFVSYPQYPETWFQGTLLDPKYPDYQFNSIFQSFILLSDNHMLIGSTDLILATRIMESNNC